MKTLQNNFTTLEQSKRLLELGVPANSADLLYHEGTRLNLERGMFLSTLEGYENFDKAVIGFRKYLSDKDMKVVPCWSAGRLIEIIRECATDFDVRKILIETLVFPATDNVDVLVRLMTADEFKNDLDFSKLEE